MLKNISTQILPCRGKPSPGTTQKKLLNIKANIYFTNSPNQSTDDIIIEWWKQNLFWEPTFASAH